VSGTELTFSRGRKKETVRIIAIDATTDPKCIDLSERTKDNSERTLEASSRSTETHFNSHSPSQGRQDRPTSFDKADRRADTRVDLQAGQGVSRSAV